MICCLTKLYLLLKISTEKEKALKERLSRLSLEKHQQSDSGSDNKKSGKKKKKKDKKKKNKKVYY